jgi:FAD/FMN-containing dehydrogenase
MNHSTNQEAIIGKLGKILPQSQIKTAHEDLQVYGQDWTRFYPPDPMAVVFPLDVKDVAKLVKLANEEDIGLVPSGGRTGLSGGALALHGEIVVSFDRMNQVLEFDVVNQTVTCQAGITTEQLQNFAEQNELYYPVDFASAGSSQLGGNISTNAGGIKVIRYGLTRDWVAGLKVVTGKGDILDLNRGLVKNATGYDLRHLFIGAEGTLGFVVEATMKLTRPPVNLKVLLLQVVNLDALMKILAGFSSEIELTAYEFFSDKALAHVVGHSDLPRPFRDASPYYALLEFEVHDDATEETVARIFESSLEAGWITDGLLSQSEAQQKKMWSYRENISEAITPYTPYKNDISVTQSNVPEFLSEVDRVVSLGYPEFELIWFGHIGDGNLHLNILKPAGLSVDQFREQCEDVNEWVFEIVEKYAGSISAEHGVGLLKKKYLSHTRSAAEIEYMAAVKHSFDPNGVMNPGKLV